MKSVNISILAFFLFVQTVASVAADEHILKHNFKGSPYPEKLLMKPDGTIVPPEEKIFFEANTKTKRELITEIDGKQLKCPLSYQSSGNLLIDKDTKYPIFILAYGACPFQVKTLSVNKEIELREETILQIESTAGNIFQLSKDSSLPFAVAVSPKGDAVIDGGICVSAINVIWKFAKSDMSFETEDAIYTTMTPSASIAFTKEGIKTDGINKRIKAKINP